MPGKSHLPDLAERIVRTLKANTNRSAGGLGSNAAPSLVRDRLAASRRGSNVVAPTAKASKVDEFTITDDVDDVFTLTFVAIPDSWNVSTGWEWGEDRYSIVGKTLTVADPADSFRGIASSGPRKLRVQYDYLTSVPYSPAGTSNITYVSDDGSFNHRFSIAGGDLLFDSTVDAVGTIRTLVPAMSDTVFELWVQDNSLNEFTYLSTDSSRCLVTAITGGKRFSWEDHNDATFNDCVFDVVDN